MNRDLKVVIGVSLSTALALSITVGTGESPVFDEVRTHQSRALSGTAVSVEFEPSQKQQAAARPSAIPVAVTTQSQPEPGQKPSFISKIKNVVTAWIGKETKPAQDAKPASAPVPETAPAQVKVAENFTTEPKASAVEAPAVGNTVAETSAPQSESRGRQPASEVAQARAQTPRVSKPVPPVEAVSEKVSSQPLVLIQPMPEPYRYREKVAKPKEVAPPPGFFARVRNAFTKLLYSEPAPAPRVPVKSAEEILAGTSRGGFEAKDTEPKAAALAMDEEERKERELAESAEAKQRKKLEAGLNQVDVEAEVTKVLSTLNRRFPGKGELIEKYVRINLGEDELPSEYSLLQEYYIDRLNEDPAGTHAALKAGLKASMGEDELIRLRIALFTLSTELSSIDKEVGRYAWGELQALKAAGEPQDVKATVAAYAAFVRTISSKDKAAKNELEDYIDDLKERDPIAGAVLQKRRSLAGYR